MAYILRHNIDVSKYDSFGALYEDLKEELPENLSHMMKLACDFNRLVYAARVRYNIILSRGGNETAVEEWQRIHDNS